MCILPILIYVCMYIYLNPVITLSKVLFPDPEGPIIAVNSPERNEPLIPWRISFVTENEIKLSSILLKCKN